MTISLVEDFKTLAELQEDLLNILGQVHRTGRPVVVTKKGKPDIVILDAAVYEQKLKTLHLGRLLAEAEADVRAGRTRPIEEFFDEMEQRGKKPPSSHRTRRRA